MQQDFVERYSYERNYGCRIREYLYQGIRHISVENELIRAVFLLDKGTDLVELVYKPKDLDVMWHSFNGRRQFSSYTASKEQGGGRFLDFYPGGSQELFPSYGGACNYRGGEIGVHGEVTQMPWEYTVVADAPERVAVKFWVRTIRTPYLLEKTVEVVTGDPVMRVKERVTNEGSTENKFMWGHHPAYGPMFLEEGCYIQPPEGATGVTDETDAGALAPLALGKPFAWPDAPLRDGGTMDVSTVPGIETKLAMSFLLKDFKDGGYRLVNPKKKLAVEMKWDAKQFPFIWVWAPYGGLEGYPWYGRTYTLAIEPWSSFPDHMDKAIENGTAVSIPAGGTIETELSWGLHEVKE